MSVPPVDSSRQYQLAPPRSNSPELISLSDLVDLLRANWVILIGLPFVFGALAMYFALSQTPYYAATALLQLDPRPAKPLARADDLYDPGYDSSKYYGTQLQILESRKLAEQLARRLDLVNVKEFGGSGFVPPPLWERMLSWIPGTPDAPPPIPLSAEERWEKTVAKVQDSAISTLAPNSTLFRISFLSQDRNLAAEAANALADLYIEELLQARLDIYAKANSWLNTKLGDVQGELNTAEKALQAYREDRNIVQVGGNRGLLEKEVTDITNRLRAAEQESQQLANIYNEIRRLSQQGSSPSDAQPLLLDPTTKDATSAVLQAKSQMRQLEQRYGVRHPQYLSAKARADALEETYRDVLIKKLRGIEANLQSARATESQLRSAKREAELRLRQLDREEFELNMLERDVRNNRQLYEMFLSRFQETESNSSFSEANARIADPAVPPREIYFPQPKKYLIIGAALGLVLAVLVILLRELLKSRIDTPEDLELLTTIPLLGVALNHNARKLDSHLVNVVTKDTRSPFSDSLRSLKTAVTIGSQAHVNTSKARCLAVSSTEPSEGKTTITAALACTFASSSTTIVIDTDLRRPRIARIFRNRSTSSTPGLADYLQGEATIDDIIRTDPASGVHFIPAGKLPSNPALLLESPAFSELLKSMHERYETLLLDTPPLLATSDALHLVPNVDGFLIVARAHKTHRKAFLGALKRLESAGAHCVGLILNDVRLRRSAYSGYYYYGSNQRY